MFRGLLWNCRKLMNYLGGQWKTSGKPSEKRDKTRERYQETTVLESSVVMELYGEVVNDVESTTLQPLITRQVSRGSIVCSDTGERIPESLQGFVHRLVNHGEKQYSDGKEIILMDWKGSGDTWNESWPSKGGSDVIKLHSISVNMSGDTTIEEKVIKMKMQEFSDC